jgi:hypothetical protein
MQRIAFEQPAHQPKVTRTVLAVNCNGATFRLCITVSRRYFWTSALILSSDGCHRPRRCFFQFAKHVKSKMAGSGLYGGWVRILKWLREQDFSFYRLGLDHRMLWQVPEHVWKLCGKIAEWCPKTPVFAFLASTYHHSRNKKKNREPHFLNFSRNTEWDFGVTRTWP